MAPAQEHRRLRLLISQLSARAPPASAVPRPELRNATAGTGTQPKLRLCIVTTSFHFRSHGHHEGDRFIVGYPRGGRWHQVRHTY